MKKVILLVIVLGEIIAAGDTFIIGAFDVCDTSYFSWAHDSLRLNTVLSGWQNSEYAYAQYLTQAESKQLKVILQNPQVGSEARLNCYTHIWHAKWESEDTFFVHNTGVSDGAAWVCSLNVHDEGLMQSGRDLWQWRIPTYKYMLDTTGVEFTARYLLKIDDTSGVNTKVCSLVVYDADSACALVESVLVKGDFQAENTYDSFDLAFQKELDTNNRIWYEIWWFGNVSLWVDYVEVKDEHIDNLIARQYNDSLNHIASTYNDYTALFRYYLMDEPRYGNFHANAYLMRYFSPPGAAQTLGDEGRPLFELYADSVVPLELWFDDYPFFGAGYDYGRTPEECGDTFQLRLDEVCENLADMRTVADTCNKDFWYAPQAFGKYDAATATNADEGGNEGRWRLPTDRELRCNTWLGLAYGAKGIMYFLYRTRLTSEEDTTEWMRGLWRLTDNSPREPLFSEAREINKTLEKIGPTLLTLTSDTVFKHPGLYYPEIPSDCFIDYISGDDTVQVGTFLDTDNDSFFIIVNRLCQETDYDTIIVRINTDSIFLYDIYTEEAIPPYIESNGKATFTFSLLPGQGRCFQLVNFASSLKINECEPYTNMRYAALNTEAWAQKTIDSMKISQTYQSPPDTLADHEYSTGWIPYDTAYCARMGSDLNI